MKKFNEVLLEIERFYYKLIVDKELKNTKVEKWRWDIPYISLVWISNDDFINRNINSIIIVEKNPKINTENKFQIEINAWKDQDEERKWYHEKIIEIQKYESSNAKKYIYQAYEEVSALTKSNLTNKKKLTQFPTH